MISKKKKRVSIRKTYSLMQPHGECCMYPTTHHSRAWRRWAKVALWEKPARDSCAGSQLGLIFNYSGLVEKSPHLKRLKLLKPIPRIYKKRGRKRGEEKSSNPDQRLTCSRVGFAGDTMRRCLYGIKCFFFGRRLRFNLIDRTQDKTPARRKKRGEGGRRRIISTQRYYKPSFLNRRVTSWKAPAIIWCWAFREYLRKS